jgi:DNA-binding transcriptional LysR family regulator
VTNCQLSAFLAVATRGSFSEAAEDLHLTQPAVSFHIQSLEESLGVRLFRRERRGTFLTPAGHSLLPYARQMLELAERAKHELQSLAHAAENSLLLGASTLAAQYFLPPLLATFQAAHPQLKIRLQVGDSEQITRCTAAGSLSLSLVDGPEDHRLLPLHPAVAWDLPLVVAAAHPLPKGEFSPADLAGVPLLLRQEGSGSRAAVEDTLSHHGLSVSDLSVAGEFPTTETLKSAVRCGLGPAFLPRMAVREDLHARRLRTVPVRGLTVKCALGIATGRHTLAAPAARRFLQLCNAPEAAREA